MGTEKIKQKPHSDYGDLFSEDKLDKKLPPPADGLAPMFDLASCVQLFKPDIKSPVNFM